MRSADTLAAFAFALAFAAGVLAGGVATGALLQVGVVGILAVVAVASGAALIVVFACLAAIHASSGKEPARLVFVRKKDGTVTVEER